ncbi:MAG: hypothetical protein JWP08_4424 [Bryobacterales bacterium]|nr:hypothetical protein [Bryobacterales bacterium]
MQLVVVIELDPETVHPTTTVPSVGGARIIDIENERKPVVVSRIRLAVINLAYRGGSVDQDPGQADVGQGYTAHYCSLPQEVDPQILACSFILSGLRVFRHPRSGPSQRDRLLQPARPPRDRIGDTGDARGLGRCPCLPSILPSTRSGTRTATTGATSSSSTPDRGSFSNCHARRRSTRRRSEAWSRTTPGAQPRDHGR